jgi:hypothetical protein
LLSPKFSKAANLFEILRWYCCLTGSWDSIIGIATCYGLDGLGLEPLVGKKFSLSVQTGLLYHGSCVFPGGKAAGLWCWPPSPSSTRVVNEQGYTCTLCPTCAFMAYYRLNFTFTFPKLTPHFASWDSIFPCQTSVLLFYLPTVSP